MGTSCVGACAEDPTTPIAAHVLLKKLLNDAPVPIREFL
jgi:hypothetical protein